MSSEKVYYNFTNGKLRPWLPLPKLGEWLEHEGDVVSESGLHASEHPFDALKHGTGTILHLVELGGELVPDGNPPERVFARRRKIVQTIDATELCLRFALRCARDVTNRWNPPEVVKRYLETGDKSLSEAASDASKTVVWETEDPVISGGAWAAKWATLPAIHAKSAALGAANSAAFAAEPGEEKQAIEKYRRWFEEMVEEEFSRAGLTDAIPGLLSGESNGAGNLIKES